MRILHVISSLSRASGGPSAAVLAMARFAAALGHDVAIHATDFGVSDAEDWSEDLGAGQMKIVFHRHIKPGSLTRHASFGLWRALAREIPKADIVHMHSLYMFHDWVVWRECARAKVPYILRPHGTLDPFMMRHHRVRKRLVNWLFQNKVTQDVTLLHFTSAAERDLAQPYTFGRPGVIVPLGVDLERLVSLPRSPEFRLRHPEIGNRRIVLFLGRLNFKKGLEILIPAFAAAAQRRLDLHLVIAGPDGGFEDQTRALIKEYALQANTTFTGNLDGGQVREAYAAADIFVLPSRTENFAIAAAEAMAAGLPSILSDQVQIAAAAAREGACCMLPLDIPQWTEAILDLLASPEEAEAMARRAREHARKTYDWHKVIERLIAMYDLAIDRYRTSELVN